jgi:hypothetical protein
MSVGEPIRRQSGQPALRELRRHAPLCPDGAADVEAFVRLARKPTTRPVKSCCSQPTDRCRLLFRRGASPAAQAEAAGSRFVLERALPRGSLARAGR